MFNQPNTYNTTVKGMLNKLKMMQAVANNIANVGTTGFKREIPESVSFKSVLSETTMRDKSQGSLTKTGNTFDIAIEGNAYFLVDSKDGLIPTKNGKLRLNEKGVLSTFDGGELVVVEKTDKPINLAEHYDISINENGEIFVGKERYGRIAMQVEDNKPVKVRQGFLEGSNANLLNEMVALSMVFRSLEASEKTLGLEASVDKELIEKYGRNV